METTNPCGEQPLALGPLRVVQPGLDRPVEIRYPAASSTGRGSATLVDIAVFLDNVIDANHFPAGRDRGDDQRQPEDRPGRGWRSFAEALGTANPATTRKRRWPRRREIMKFIEERAVAKSAEIADRRGSFPNFEGSLWQQTRL